MMLFVILCLLVLVTPASAVVTATDLTTQGVSSAGTSEDTASITPSPNKLIIACVLNETPSGTPPTPTLSGNGLTWVEVESREQGLSRQTMFRAMATAPTAGVVTITWSTSQGSAAWSIFELGNVETGGTHGSIALVRSASNSASSGLNISGGAILAPFFSQNNATVGCFGADQNVVLSPGVGFSQIAQSTVGGSRLLSEFNAAPDETVGATSAGSAALTLIGAEICAATVAGSRKDEGQIFSMLRWVLSPLLAWAATCPENEEPTGPLPVFPGAEGFGITTPAGRGGTVYRVTTTSSGSGAGTLRACLFATEPRVCIFETSGVIQTGGITISSPFLTVAGATAPSPGILLEGIITIETHDIYFSHVEMRSNDNSNNSALTVRNSATTINGGTYNLVFDHVSFGWAVDTTINIWEYMRDVTVSNSIIAEGLDESIHVEGGVQQAHGMGLLIGSPPTAAAGAAPVRIAILKNLFIHNTVRSPLFSGSGIVANNLIYNYQNQAISLTATNSAPSNINIVGNKAIEGNDWNGSNPLVRILPTLPSASSKFYVLDSCVPSGDFSSQGYTSDPWSFVENASSFTDAQLKSATPLAAYWPTGYTPQACSAIEAYTKLHSGSRPTNRNIADSRVINDITNRTGTQKDCIYACPGPDINGDGPGVPVPNTPPTRAVNARALTLPSIPTGDSDGDGYTNLEEWLHGYAAGVE